MSQRWQVHKFGGTSLADPDRYRNAAGLVADADHPIAVVVSAMAGVTDELIALLELAREADGSHSARLSDLGQRHRASVDALIPEDARNGLHAAIDRGVRELEHLLRTVSLVHGIPDEARDLVSGYGEIWSAQILSALLTARGHDATWMDAREVLVVEQGETGPRVDWDVSAQRLRAWRSAHPEEVVVITGFVAATPDGTPTTLRRNGSDFTASIFGALLEAGSVTIWTDVDGVMSADPRLVPEAFVLPELSYDEAMELAYFGAGVLHPNTMAPVIRHGIPILIRNSRDPSAPCTRIGPPGRRDAPARPADTVRALSTFGNLTLVNVEGTGMIGVPGIAERLFGALREVGVSVVMISQASSEHSICFVVPADQSGRAKAIVEKAFFAELHHGQIQRVELTGPCTILAAVGDAMAETPGVASRFFRALGSVGVNVRAVAQGASERNITAVIEQDDAVRALRAVHAAFYLSEQTLSVGIVGCGTVGSVLIDQLRRQSANLRERFHIDLRVRGIARSGRMLLADPTIDLGTWRARLENDGVPSDLDDFTDRIDSDRLPHAVLVDCTTSEDVARRYPQWLERGIHVVTPNKKAGSGTQASYRSVRDAARASGTHYLYEATVGAGLPIITTLRDLIQTGDRVRRIEGVLSGTLSYLFNVFTGEPSFSTLVRQAREAGFTEPDPRDDLSGTDVARKLIILAREIDLERELTDLAVESLVPRPLRGTRSVDEFLDGLAGYDETMLRLYEKARAGGQVLRYVGRIDETGTASVSMERYPAGHAFAGLTGADNIVAFTTDRYAEQPLIVRGPGAGPEVTAGGVFADLLRLAAYLGAPS